LFGLERVADSRVGTTTMRGISGGEKKRTAIACEFVTDPGILQHNQILIELGLILLDEPTSYAIKWSIE
jgi:ABC-type multidrug transport system ATPase subunit